VATIRNKGQVTIPAHIRKAAHLEEGDPVEFELVAEGILLRPGKVIDATQAWFWTPEWQAQMAAWRSAPRILRKRRELRRKHNWKRSRFYHCFLPHRLGLRELAFTP